MKEINMRLSEAIRLGAAMKPQSFDGYAGVGSCALMAASEAIGLAPVCYGGGGNQLASCPYMDLYLAFSVLRTGKLPCPEFACVGGPADDLCDLIYHLNDFHKWSRERIADFVELYEPLPEPQEATCEAHTEVRPR